MIEAKYVSAQIGGSQIEVRIQVPSTTEEYDILAKKPGAALQAAVNHEVYHGLLSDFRSEFAERFEKAVTAEHPEHSELKRKTKVLRTKKTADGEEEVLGWAESDVQYLRRALGVLAALRGVDEVQIASFQNIADEILADVERDENGQPTLDENGQEKPLIRFDPSRPERGEKGPKTLPQIYIRAARKYVEKGTINRFITHFNLTVNPPEGASEEQITDTKVEAVARKIKALEDAERAQQDLASKYENLGAE